jgi:hypothetical protein
MCTRPCSDLILWLCPNTTTTHPLQLSPPRPQRDAATHPLVIHRRATTTWASCVPLPPPPCAHPPPSHRNRALPSPSSATITRHPLSSSASAHLPTPLGSPSRRSPSRSHRPSPANHLFLSPLMDFNVLVSLVRWMFLVLLHVALFVLMTSLLCLFSYRLSLKIKS